MVPLRFFAAIFSRMALIKGYPYMEAKYHSDRRGNEPKILVIHYTAGRGNGLRLAKYFAAGQREASAHFGIGRPGEVYQMVDTDRNAWHAGKSKFRDSRIPVGRQSIGVEICNTGGAYLKDDDPKFVGKHRNPRAKRTTWEPYTRSQQKSLEKLIIDLRAVHPTLQYVTGHEDICNSDVVDIKGGKIDPGPAFPWATTNWHGLEQWHWSFRDKMWYSVPQGKGPTH